MKKLITILSIALTLTIANTATARSLHPDTGMVETQLNEVFVAEDSPLAESNINGTAFLQIRPVEGTIKLFIYRHRDCRPGLNTFCPAVMTPPIMYTVLLTERKTDSCGLNIYEGVLDNLADEDELTYIKVVDSSTAICEALFPAVSVNLIRIYNTEDGVEKYNHYLSGDEFLTSPF